MTNLTKPKLRLSVQKKMAALCKKAGSQANLAKELKLSTASINRMINGHIMPGPRVCVLVESKYGLKKEDLRPDLFLLD